jgi:hypothetical protein
MRILKITPATAAFAALEKLCARIMPSLRFAQRKVAQLPVVRVAPLLQFSPSTCRHQLF